MKIRFLTLADQEVDDAVAWYDQQGSNISRGFLDDLDRAVRLAKTYPLLATQLEPPSPTPPNEVTNAGWY